MATLLRPELGTLPRRLRALPVDARGYPVPWFVGWINGVPEFRCMDPAKWLRAVRERRCWVCGEPLGQWLAFLIGPMCAINRTTSEPACHRECANWSARNCPFMSRPHMVRREGGLPEDAGPGAGFPIDRNPGVGLVWVTRSFRVFNDGRGRPLIEIGPADAVEWWSCGRPATRAEVEESFRTGVPILAAKCEEEATVQRQVLASEELVRRLDAARALWPVH